MKIANNLFGSGCAGLGIGVGWMKDEFDAIGVSFHDRGKRTDEYVAAMRGLWSAAKPTFHGEFVYFYAAYCRPQPVRKSIPNIVGGDSKFAARRAGRLGDGYFPARGAPLDLFALARLTAEQHGRNPDALEITESLPKDLEEIPQLAAAGVNRIAVSVSTGIGPNTVISTPEDALQWRDIIARYAEV